MECQEVAIDRKELPVVIAGLEYREGMPILRRIVSLLGILSLLLTFGEFLVLVFGPDRIFISASGMTFTEFLLIYPGPLASIGLFMALISQRLFVGIENQTHRDSITYFRKNIRIVFKGSAEPVGALPIVYLGDGNWQIGIAGDYSSKNDKKSI